MTGIPKYILAPYVPTPPDTIGQILEFANVTAADHFYDLGCGDGRVIIEAARRYGCRSVGFEFEPHWVAEARRNADAAGVGHLVRIESGDAFAADLSSASVIFLYLVHWSMQKIAPLIARQTAPGTRVVSMNYPVDMWPHPRTAHLRDDNGCERKLYCWEMGEDA